MSLPDEGQIDTCRLCDIEIAWEFDDPDYNSDNPYGYWWSPAGLNVCPATDEEAADQSHQPTEFDMSTFGGDVK